jgi:hypothetical protein
MSHFHGWEASVTFRTIMKRTDGWTCLPYVRPGPAVHELGLTDVSFRVKVILLHLKLLSLRVVRLFVVC